MVRTLVVVPLLVALAGPACKRTPPPSCEALGAHVVKLFAPADDYARDVGAVFAAQCTAQGWSAEVRACIAATRALVEPKNCRIKLTEAQRTELDAKLAEADARQRARVIPEVCVRYERAVEKLATCAQLPLEARTALRAKLDAAKRDWPSIPDKRTLEPVCGAAIQATRSAFGVECPGAW